MEAAYLRLLGRTQREAAEAVGIGERTLRGWEHRPEWRAAVEEARERWLGDVDTRARQLLLKALRDAEAGDPIRAAQLALEVLERLEPKLARPPRRLEHSGPQGETIHHGVVVLPALLDASEDP